MRRIHPEGEKYGAGWLQAGWLLTPKKVEWPPMEATLERLYLSPGHNFFGHHGQPAGTHPACAVPELQCLAGRGIAGDRFLDYKPDYAGQITFFEAEVFEGLCATLRLSGASPAGLRRNVVTRGIVLETLAGREFCVQGVWFRGAGECKPCYWMDAALGPGAEAWLRGRGGLRARILTDGVLRPGAVDQVASSSVSASQSARVAVRQVSSIRV